MIFGPTSLEEAEGAILAHTQRLSGTAENPGRVIKKGALLDADAIAALRTDGITRVIAARLEHGDVREDEAATRFASALSVRNITLSRAATGRANFSAGVPGLLRVNAAAIDALNEVDEALTIGTLPDYSIVSPREMVATVKIIPFAVPGPAVALAEKMAAQSGTALEIHPFRRLRVGLVMSELKGLKQSVLDGTVEATKARVERLTGTLLPPRRCTHDEAAIAESVTALITEGAQLILIAGASAVVDRRDVGPAAILRAGGSILHFGMPVDPGNLICVGRIGDVPALVLPGCARSPALNGIDFALARLFAGLPLTGREIARLGVGGLLKEMQGRPLPRAKAVPSRPEDAPPAGKGVAAIVLAAGLSRRMGSANKLLALMPGGKAMIARTVDNILASSARPIIVVLGHEPDAIRAALGGRPVRYITATDYEEGLAASLRAGIAALPQEARAALICLGDMPLIPGRVLDRLIETYDPDEGRLIVQPIHEGKPGNPLLWDRRYFPDILTLTGDAGARRILAEHADALAELLCPEPGVLRDFDTPEALAEITA